MSLKYILGGSGYGKTMYCFKDIKNKLSNESDNSIIYIVPEQFTHESERNLINYLEEESLIRGEVLSFKRLAFHLISKEGGLPKKIIDETTKNMIIKKIALDNKAVFKYYNKSLKKVGFIKEVGKLITEFSKYNVTVEKLDIYLNKLKDDITTYNKINDLALIYKNYNIYVKDRGVCIDCVLDILVEKIKNYDFLDNAEIWIDGFNSFTPQELNVIKELLIKCKNVNITLTLKEKKIFYYNLNMMDSFYEVKNTVNKITKKANEIGVKVDIPIYLNECYRLKNNVEMLFLERNYFYNNKSFLNKVNNVYILENLNIYEEVENVSKIVVYLIREKNISYSDISIITGNLSGYKNIVEMIFNKYDINYFIDKKETITVHPLTEFIISMIDVVATNFSYEAIFRFLKTNLTPMEQEDVYILENYVLANGIKGTIWLKKDFTYGFEDEIFKEKINFLKREFIRYIEPIISCFKNKKATVKEISISIFNVIENLKIRDELSNLINNAESVKNHILAKIHGNTWDSVMDLFTKLVEVLEEDKFTSKEFAKVIETGLKSMEIGVIPYQQDKITVGDLKRTRLPKTKVLFILGVNEGMIPEIPTEKGFFSDEEKENFIKNDIHLTSTSKQRSYEERFNIYSAITKAEEYLYISYNRGDLLGKPIRVSRLITSIKNMFPKINIINNLDDTITLPQAMFSNIGNTLGNYIKDNNINPIDKDLYNWYRNDINYCKKISNIEEILLSNYSNEYLSENTINKLYGNKINTSVSRLEKYMRCPYAYFVEYNLRAKERKLYELKALDYGNIIHDILEVYAKYLYENKISWRDMPQNELNEVVEYCINEVVADERNNIFQNKESSKYMLKNIKKMVRRSIWVLNEHIKNGLFEVYKSEVEFKENTLLNSIYIDINEKQKIILTGRIDRIDVYKSEDNKKYIKIIDYKTGSIQFNIEDVYFGIQLQLILYIDAFLKNSKTIFGEGNITTEVLPGGIFYFNIKNPIVEVTEELSETAIESLIFDTFKMTGLVVADEDVIKSLDTTLESSSSIIPVSLKKDGSYDGNTSVVTLEEFNEVREAVISKTKEIGRDIFNGVIKPFPYKKGKETACDYCNYNAICMFALKEENKKYNIVKKLK